MVGNKRSNEESNNDYIKKRKHSCAYIPLYLAAKRNDADECKSILLENHQVDVNEKSSDGNTVLHEAVKYDSTDVCNVLLEHGADITSKNKYGYTPLHVGAQNNSLEACKVLLDNKAAVGAKNVFNNTPLHVAARHNRSDVCKILLENGADIDSKGINDCTPLHLAVENNCEESCTVLLDHEHELNVNARNKAGKMALHDAACKWDGDRIFRILINYGADINATDSKGKTALHICCAIMMQQCRKGSKTFKRSSYYNMVENLLTYGADPNMENLQGESCFTICESAPEIKKFLEEFSKMSLYQKWRKSGQRSEMYNSVLSKVVKGQQSKKISYYEYFSKPIGFGAFGHVHAGVNTKDGREVAVKRIDISRLPTLLHKREIKNLVRLDHCANIVNYLDFEEKENLHFIILELMEGTLDDFLQKPTMDGVPVDKMKMCQDVVNALQFLHKNNIIHRDIKPNNILYTLIPRVTLKLADFGLSTKIEKETTTVMHTTAGTRCWMAKEVLEDMDHSTASDVFSCGLVLYYLLVPKKHPFSTQENMARKSNHFMTEHEITTNILSHSLNMDECKNPEAHHLIERMLCDDKDQRPSAEELLLHPFFWSKQKKIEFLGATGNQPEIGQNTPSNFGKDLEASLGHQFHIKPWSEWNPTMIKIYNEMMSPVRRKYVTSSAVDLLRFIRNAYQHVSDKSRTEDFKTCLLDDYVFLDMFESVVVEVYKNVLKHQWDKNRKEIRNSISVNTEY